jgi:hypothetical protein
MADITFLGSFRMKKQSILRQYRQCRTLTILTMAMLGLVLAFGIIVVACDSGIGSSTTKTIKYQLTGTIPSVNSVMYMNSTGGYDHLNNVTLPWEISFSVTIEKNKYFGATVSGTASAKGTLTAKIFVNGTEVKSVNGSGDTFIDATAIEIIRN